MPLVRGPALFLRAWRWADRLASGDAVTRADLDAVADEIGGALTETYRIARRRAIPFEELPPTGEPFEEVVTIQPDDRLHMRQWRITGWVTTHIMDLDGTVTAQEAAGQASADTTPPPKPLGWFATPTLDGVLFRGQASPATDFRAFRLWEAEVGQPSILATLVDERAALQIQRVGMAQGTQRQFWISAVDTSGNDSEKSDPMIAGPSPTIVEFDQRITNVQAIAEDAQARVTTIETGYTTADGALAQRLDIIEADYLTAGGLDESLTLAVSAAITTEQTARASADGALAGRLDTIEASYQTATDVTGAITTAVSAAIATEQTARASADGALAGRLDTIEASYQTAGDVAGAITTAVSAAITAEQIARVDADGALATRIGTIEASYQTAGDVAVSVLAAITTEQTARASADGALAGRLDTIEASYQTAGNVATAVSAAITAEQTARASADGALAGRLDTIEASYQTAGDVTGAITTAVSAAITAEQTARANADGALATRIDTIEASYQTAGDVTGAVTTAVSAAIATEQIARANADGALAGRLDTIEAEYQTADHIAAAVSAAITTEQTARASADGALAQRLDTIEASYQTATDVTGAITTAVSSAITAEQTARSSADNALAQRLETVEAEYQTADSVAEVITLAVSSAITAEQIARASADGALAGRLDTVEATYINTAAATNIAQTQATTIANAAVAAEAIARASADGALTTRLDGVEASYTILMDAIGALDGNFDVVQATIDAAVAVEATARVDADGALATRIGTIEASYVTTGAMTAAVNAKATEITNAYAAADSALANRAAALEATVNNPTTGHAATRAQVAQNENALATESGARATAISTLRAEALSVAATTTSVIDDTRFGNHAAPGTPSWSRWGGQGVLTTPPQPGGKSLRFAVTGTQSDGAVVASTRPTWVGVKDAAAYVVEIEATRHSGFMEGAGVILDWQTTIGTHRTTRRLAEMAADGPVGGRARYRTILRKPANAGADFVQHLFYLMVNWNGFGGPMAAKDVEFHACVLRPATPEELGGGEIGAVITTALNAEVAARTQAIADETSARTLAITSATSSITGGSARTLAQIDADQLAKGIVIYAPTAPTALVHRQPQNLWIDTGGTPARNRPHRWNGSAWAAVPDSGIAAAQAEAASKGRVIYSTTAPTAAADRQPQNLWIDTGGTPARNEPHRWNGSAWVKVEPAALVQARADITTLQLTKVDATGARAEADTRISAALQTGGAIKSAIDTGDATIRGGSTETLASVDAKVLSRVTPSEAEAIASNRVSAGLQSGGDIRTQIDTKGVVIYSTTAPTAIADRRPQNLWIDTGGTPARNRPHRWNGSAWAAVPDASIAAALAEAQTKGRVIYATAAPTAAADRQPQNLWIDTGGSPARNDPYRWSGSAWVKIEPAALTTAKADISTLQSTKVDAAGARAQADTRISAALQTGGAIKSAIDTGDATIRGGSTETLASLNTKVLARTTPAEAQAISLQQITAEMATTGGNRLANADFRNGTAGWVINNANGPNTTLHQRVHPSSWSAPGRPTLMLHQNSSVTTGYTDCRAVVAGQSGAEYYGLAPCSPGQVWEAAARVSTHRCRAQLRIEWRNADNAVIGYTSASTMAEDASSSTDPSVWTRLWTRGTAPANAAMAVFHLRKMATDEGRADSFVFLFEPQLNRTTLEATIPRAWSLGLAESPNTRADISSLQSTKVDAAGARAQAATEINAALSAFGPITGAINARVQQETNARVNGDNALAGQMHEFYVNYNGTAATVSTHAHAIAGLEQREAAYKIRANAGVPGGLEIVSNANGSKVKLYGTELILDFSVVTNLLATDAVTQTLTGVRSSDGTLFAFNLPRAGIVSLFGAANLYWEWQRDLSPWYWRARVFVNWVLVASASGNVLRPESAGVTQSTLIGSIAVPAGVSTVSVVFDRPLGGGNYGDRNVSVFGTRFTA